MKFGHHGANHPVQELASGRVSITSQNHGFAVDEATLPTNVIPTHRSLFDGTPAGTRAHRPAGLQLPGPSGGEPRAARPKPLFENFVQAMVRRLQRQLRTLRSGSRKQSG